MPGIVGGAGLLTLIVFGVPIAFALGLTGLFITTVLLGSPLSGPALVAYTALESPVLATIPLFILMSNIMIRSKVNDELFAVTQAWLGRVPGGLGVVTVAACGLFAALTGSSVATAMAVGSLSVPQMLARGYSERLAYGVAMASGTFGLMIPPSIPLILYGIITEESIGRLFAAGIVPGLFSALLYALYVMVASRREVNAREDPDFTWRQKWQVTRRGLWGFSIVPVALGGIYLGWFSPTEAAAVGVALAVVIGALVKRGIARQGLLEAAADAAKTSSMVFLVIVGAKIFSYSLTMARIPQEAAAWVLSFNLEAWQLMFMLSAMFFVLGMFFDVTPIVLMTVPVIHPILLEYNIDLIWFAIILVKNMEMANITPPVGMSMNVLKQHFGISSSLAARSTLPFLGVDFITLLALIFFPQITLWLPNLLFQ